MISCNIACMLVLFYRCYAYVCNTDHLHSGSQASQHSLNFIANPLPVRRVGCTYIVAVLFSICQIFVLFLFRMPPLLLIKYLLPLLRRSFKCHLHSVKIQAETSSFHCLDKFQHKDFFLSFEFLHMVYSPKTIDMLSN